MKQPLSFAGLALALLALAAAHADAAQLYKWVDERGVVTYSDSPPADPASVTRVTTVADRVSVYTPDASLVQEIEANRERLLRAARERAETYRPAVAAIGGPAPAPAPYPAPEPLVLDYPYWIGSGIVPNRVRPPRALPQIQLPPGAIAGNIVGMNGLIPGNTASAPSAPPLARPAHRRAAPSRRNPRDWR